jgi:cell division protein FtsW
MVQASEVAKVCAIIFFASFFARRYQELHFGWQGFLKPMLIIGVFVFLLLLEPDFGSSVVLSATVITMMFIAGVRMFHFLLLIGIGVGGMAAVAILSPYRMRRLITFLDPWADQFNSGYQLTQSLIGFGRGEWVGLGLGNGLQKLFFLPEAHTDFIFAIVAEEFGLIGATVVFSIFVALIVRILMVAKNNLARGKMFAALATFGIGILFTFQVFINVGVSSGLLPTKGLTLPFISYGGSSLLVCCVLMAFVMRAQWEVAGLHGAEVLAPQEQTKRQPVIL